jgi:single-strand DNA-binding protein
MYFNRAIVFGNLTRDPELKALPSGSHVATFSIATNRVFKDRTGQNQTEVQYHNIVVFGRQAETTFQYLKKGATALIEGRIQNRSWDAPDGQKRYRSEIVAERVQFGPRLGGGGAGASAPHPSSSAQTGAKEGEAVRGGAKPAEIETIDYPDEEINPDDIPF